METDEQDDVEAVVPAKEVEFNVETLVPKDETLNDILTRFCRPGWKPDIYDLAPAIVDEKLIVEKGQKLLIEYPDMWRDTVAWIVLAVNPANTLTSPGYVRLYDPFRMCFGSTNFIDGPKRGLLFKVPDNSRKWIPGEEEPINRRRRHASEEKPKPTPVLDENGNVVKKKRGRPKGSKSKTTLEREAKLAAEAMSK